MKKARATVAIGLAVFAFAVQTVAFASSSGEPQHLFKLRAETDSFASFCGRAGITLSGTKPPSVVLKVDYGSFAFWAGIQKDDRILSADAQQNAIMIERNGRQYCAQLPASAGAVNLQGRQLAMASAVPKFSSETAASNVPSSSQPFLPEAIARLGPNAVRQGSAPNCWFEAAMSAVSMSPKGQKLISQMISKNSTDSFRVQFPHDPQSFVVTGGDMARYGILDYDQWASILECAEREKFPDNDASEGPQVGIPLIYRGLCVLSGTEARFERPDNMSLGSLSALISSALSAQRPIIMATKSPQENGHLPQIVMPNHAYTILKFDSASGKLVLRNPYGSIEEVLLQDVPLYFRYISWVEW